MHIVPEAGVGVEFFSAVILHTVVAFVQPQDVLAAHLQQMMAP